MRQSNPQGQFDLARWPFGILFDNAGEVGVGPVEPQVEPEPAPEPSPEPAPSPEPTGAGWKSRMPTDLKNSPLLQKFDDSPEGLVKAFESHANLESLLGHEKVPIPKGLDDKEGWSRFSKALGIPDKAENYGLPDAELPESMKDLTMDKHRFAEIVHAHKLTPDQAKGLWKAYQDVNAEAYQNTMQKVQERIDTTVNQLKSEWGDAYDSKVEVGQMVLNKFSDDQEMNDFLTQALTSDPRGVKFLAKVGDQFAENKIGDFQYQRFTLAPEQAQEEIDGLVKDSDGPYMNQSGKFTDREHAQAVDRVNHLRSIIAKAKG